MVQILGKEVGDIGYGLMGLTWRANPPPRDQSFAAMRTALSKGAVLWNGGELYGTVERNSLHLLNEYFTQYPEDAEKVVISIKGGLVPGSFAPDGSRKNVTRSVEECLRVLGGKKKLDLFECARVDHNVPIEETIETLAEYVKAGKLGGISLSECSADSIRRAAKVHEIACVEVEFSLWATDIIDAGVAQACAELNIPIIAYSPLGRGFLTGQLRSPADIPKDDFRSTMPRFQPGTFEENLKLVDEVKKVADKKGVTPGQVALAWVKAQSGKKGMPSIIPIPGATTAERVEENFTKVTLSAEELAEVDEIVDKAVVTGGRYGGPAAVHMFGDSAPLQE